MVYTTILINLLLSIYILSLSHLYLPTRLLLIFCLLYVLQGIHTQLDYRESRPIRLEKIRPGTFITYSYVRPLDVNISPLLLNRLMGSRFLHFALVVSHQDQPHVIEWRYYRDFKEFQVARAKIGYINLVPLQKYIESLSHKGVIFRMYYPPSNKELSYSKEVVDELKQGYTICSHFAVSYYNKMTGGRLSPFLYIPENCVIELMKSNWKEEYCVDT